MREPSRERAGRGILLAGAAVLLAMGAARLPAPRDIVRRPVTPLDRTDSRHAAPAYRLLSHAASVVPEGAVAAVRSEPRSAADETMLHFLGVALLPGRRVLPAAAWSQFTPEYEAQADYILVVGATPPQGYGASERLRLLYSDPEGTVWKRGSR